MIFGHRNKIRFCLQVTEYETACCPQLLMQHVDRSSSFARAFSNFQAALLPLLLLVVRFCDVMTAYTSTTLAEAQVYFVTRRQMRGVGLLNKVLKAVLTTDEHHEIMFLYRCDGRRWPCQPSSLLMTS